LCRVHLRGKCFQSEDSGYPACVARA